MFIILSEGINTRQNAKGPHWGKQVEVFILLAMQRILQVRMSQVFQWRCLGLTPWKRALNEMLIQVTQWAVLSHGTCQSLRDTGTRTGEIESMGDTVSRNFHQVEERSQPFLPPHNLAHFSSLYSLLAIFRKTCSSMAEGKSSKNFTLVNTWQTHFQKQGSEEIETINGRGRGKYFNTTSQGCV